MPASANGTTVERDAVPTHLSVLFAILPLIQNINAVFLFLEVFDRLESGERMYAARLTFYCLVCVGVGSVAFALLSDGDVEVDIKKQRRRRRRLRHRNSSTEIISFAILLLLLYALSPVLKTLTEATTSDTIYPLAFLLFALHVSLADNTLRGSKGGRVSGSSDSAAPAAPPRLSSALSLNAATSASLVLASRLTRNSHVFALMFASIIAFALFPLFVNRVVPRASLRFAIVAALIVVSTATTSMLTLVAATNAFLTLVVPFWMRVASRKKARYDGPWKIASPQLRAPRA